MGGTLWRKIGAPGANITVQWGVRTYDFVTFCPKRGTEGSEMETSAYPMNQNEKSEFPARLRKLREERRQSRVVVSELCGLDRGAVRCYERGERSPTLEALVALADYFEVSLDYLTGRTNFR